jgi:hypothetical protein
MTTTKKKIRLPFAGMTTSSHDTPAMNSDQLLNLAIYKRPRKSANEKLCCSETPTNSRAPGSDGQQTKQKL